MVKILLMLIILALVIDRVGLWLDDRGIITWRRRRRVRPPGRRSDDVFTRPMRDVSEAGAADVDAAADAARKKARQPEL